VNMFDRFRYRDNSSDERLRQPLHQRSATTVSESNCSCDDLLDGLSTTSAAGARNQSRVREN
jgi:hypothetical protein